MEQNDTDREAPEFNASLPMHLVDTWWQLGRRLSPFVGSGTSELRRDVFIEEWLASAREGSESDALSALTAEKLREFIATALSVLEDKFEGRDVADRVALLIAAATFDVADEGRLLRLTEKPDAFWSWEYLYLFTELHAENKPSWLTAVGRCQHCTLFFVKSRSDQRFHDDSCRKMSANKRFYNRSKKPKATRPGKR